MYSQIIYDPFRKYYYRMVNYAYQTDSSGKINSFYKPFSIIIADSSFQKIGEFIAPATYFPNNLLISKEGVILLNQEKVDGIFRVTFELYSLEKYE